MRFSITKKLYAGFSAAIIVSLLIGLFTFLTLKERGKHSDWVRHTYKVLNHVGNIQNVVIDMEAGRRAFRATDDKKYLQSYHQGLNTIHKAIDDFKQLVADNEVQSKHAFTLERHINDLLAYWAILGEDASKYTRADISVVNDREQVLTDIINNDINALIQAEEQLLVKREEDMAKSRNLSFIVSIAGTFLILLIIMALISTILSEFKNRRRAEKSLKDSLDELNLMNEESNKRNWLLTGVSNVNDNLQGTEDYSALTTALVRAIVDYLGMPAGAVYTYDAEKLKLVLRASVGMPSDAQVEYGLNEGIVGRAASSKEILHVKNIPSNYWQLKSSAGKVAPGEIVCLPLWYNRRLKGVLELASFGAIKPHKVNFLNVISNNIAIALNAAEGREKIMELLGQVQEQKVSLQNQQEELTQTNEELTRQAEALQASEEELRVQEEELRQINAELEEKNEAVEFSRQALTMKARELEETGRYKSEFLANMSHELRTPLNSVLILAKLLADNKGANLTSKQVEYSNIIHKSGTDLLTLINDILDLSKIEAGKIDLSFENVKVDHIIKDLEQTFHVVAEQKGVQFICKKASEVPDRVNTDKQRLEQVIKNLLSNAFKFTSKAGKVTLAFDIKENDGIDVLEVSVSDTGIGIPKDKQQLIFEAFQQADGSTSRKYGGTGLGLSISKELIRKLGGEIKLRSEENVGSTFTLCLPLNENRIQSHVVKTTGLVESEIEVTGQIEEQDKVNDDRAAIQKGDRVILIVEDDPHFASLVQDFARGNNYKTIVALQGDEGLYYARKYVPSAIILDIQLPVLDGWSVLKMLKADDKLKHIPVHIMSATDEGDYINNSAVAFLKKPLDKEDLERAFSIIGDTIKDDDKKVLVLSGRYLKDNFLKSLIEARHFNIACDYADSLDKAKDFLRANAYDSIIVDIGKDLNEGKELLKNIQPIKGRDVPVIIYLDNDLSLQDEMQLKKLANVVIQDSLQSKDRLMDELELFLYKVQEVENNPLPQKQRVFENDKVLHGKKVLLADDDMRNLFSLTTLLEGQQMEVVTAGDGKEALTQLDVNEDIDIVLMDIMMPEMDGYEAIRRIRSDAKLKKLPVIALTAKAMQGDKEKAIAAGASDYITKPVDTNRLFSLMRVWLSA